jgi:tetratricopeptide (TPR) repeat protein
MTALGHPIMLGFGWLTLRQAQEAVESGRLEEAQRLLGRPEALGHKGSSALLKQIAQAYIERGEQHLQHEDLAAAWKDLKEAEKIGTSGAAAARLRQALTRAGLEEARTLLDAGEPSRATELLSRLNGGSVRQAEAQLLEEVAKGWTMARDLAGRGEIGRALETVNRVRPMLADAPAALERFGKQLEQQRPSFGTLLVQLHEAWAQEHWRDVVRLAEQILAVAPLHVEARKAQARAWKAIEREPKVAARTPEETDPSRRFMLWIDGVGGYLVCLAGRVTFGQAAPDAFVDVPLLADVSRTHAVLRRDAEGYLLEAVRSVRVNGQPVEKALLQPGDRIMLGSTCQVQFRQPVPVSATARLDLVSGHRLPLAVDAVLLMADTLILGPGSQAHVQVPDLEHPVVLFRHKEGLGVRYAGSLTVDGEPCRERAVLGPTSHVRADNFTFAVEPVGARMGRV